MIKKPKNKKERKERLHYFNESILPLLRDKYFVLEYPSFIKIIINKQDKDDIAFDYYPQGQKISKKVNGSYIWRDLSISEFKSKFL